MKLGIDIDGCLNDFGGCFTNLIKKDYPDFYVPEEQYEIFKPFNFKGNEYREFTSKYYPELHNIMPAEQYSKITLDLLKNKYQIDIITAREYYNADITEKWLKNNGLYYDNIFFQSGNKADVCSWRNVNFMIEDKAENALAIANANIPVLLYDRPYNKTVEHKNIKRIKNWNEIYLLLR